MQVQSINSSTSFGAKFLHSDSLKEVAQYAVEHGKFDKLNQSRLNIAKNYLTKRIKFDLYTNEKGVPYIVFTRFTPKYGKFPESFDDYKNPLKIIYKADKKMNPLKYGLRMLIKLGNNAPRNKMYKNVIIKVQKTIHFK